MKKRLRRLADLVGASTGALHACERRMRSGLTILMYHRVLPRADCRDYPLQALVIPEDAFEEQMAWLAAHCEVLPVGEAVSWLDSGCERRQRPVVSITFDDGYVDNYDVAAPILARHDLRATFFVTSGFVETGAPLWFDRAAALWYGLAPQVRQDVMLQLDDASGHSRSKRDLTTGVHLDAWMAALKTLDPERLNAALEAATAKSTSPPDLRLAVPMQVSHLAELHRAGHEVAAHSVSHPILPNLDRRAAEREIAQSRCRISEWIGAQVDGFCYPNGDYDAHNLDCVRSLGFRYACATTPGLNTGVANRFRLHRRSVTMHRALGIYGRPDMLAFRGELSGIREVWR